ncbi:MAG: hypothetical protein JO108_27075 [Acidobacteriaceae bacterium]|nr:hypothetical protein [Acidobacteriaceae bacterium]
MASYGIGFWLPQILSENSSKDPWVIGLLSMIPWAVCAAAMILVGRHSDLSGERCWHVSRSGFTAFVGFTLSSIPHLPSGFGLFALSLATAGVMASIATFWSLSAGLLRSTAAAAGIAWINSVGSLAGYVSPYWVGEGSRCNEQHGMAVTALSWLVSRCRHRRPSPPLSIATESVAFVRTTHERMKRQGGKLNANATISD